MASEALCGPAQWTFAGSIPTTLHWKALFHNLQGFSKLTVLLELLEKVFKILMWQGWWCAPVIPASWEAEVGGLWDWGQPEQHSKTPTQRRKQKQNPNVQARHISHQFIQNYLGWAQQSLRACDRSWSSASKNLMCIGHLGIWPINLTWKIRGHASNLLSILFQLLLLCSWVSIYLHFPSLVINYIYFTATLRVSFKCHFLERANCYC